ncbi:MAG: DUF455 family protein [Archangium sp.]|nr:DUF455 family protein [Archangium sp.]
MSEHAPPPAGTVERWAWDFVTSTRLADKLSPPPPPSEWSHPTHELRLTAPGRPAELVARAHKKKTPKVHLQARRAEVLHTFLHHELQAAELMAWAILAFPSTPPSFRRGLLSLCRDEIRHLQMYRDHLVTLGHPFGSFPINDWFWRRVPNDNATPAHFVARLGIAFEGANLDHGARYTAAFAAAGDARAAEIQAQIVEEEVPHTAFGLHWFEAFTGTVAFDTWRTYLPAPISPVMARGTPFNVEARRKAGYSDDFMASLVGWSSGPEGKL